MTRLEIEELTRVANSMSKEERMITLSNFPVDELIETIYAKYNDLKIKCDSIKGILSEE